MKKIIQLEDWYAIGQDAEGVWRMNFLAPRNKKIATNHLQRLLRERKMCSVISLVNCEELTE